MLVPKILRACHLNHNADSNDPAKTSDGSFNNDLEMSRILAILWRVAPQRFHHMRAVLLAVFLVNVVFAFQIHESFLLTDRIIEFFLNNTNLTFLAVLYKIDIKGLQNQ